MRAWSLVGAALLAVALPACSDLNLVAPGVYTASADEAKGVSVSISDDKRTVTFQVPGSAPVTRSATVWDKSRWPNFCPHGMKDGRSEILDLGPDPLVLGKIRVEKPVLAADCMHHPVVNLMPQRPNDAPGPPALAFKR